jgi:hypothetical protein
MRSFLLGLGICILLFTVLVPNACAAGNFVVGKEKCVCSPLVKAGIVPDTLNQLCQFPGWDFFSGVVDRFAGEIKAILGQFGVKTTHHWSRAQQGASAKYATRRVPKKVKKRKVKLPPSAK